MFSSCWNISDFDAVLIDYLINAAYTPVTNYIFMADVSEDPGDTPQEMRPLALITNRTLTKAPLSASSTQSDVIDSRQSHDSDRTVSQTSGWVCLVLLSYFTLTHKCLTSQ